MRNCGADLTSSSLFVRTGRLLTGESSAHKLRCFHILREARLLL